MRKFITLTTDFGIDDSYVGIMKGILLKILPSVQLIDITHQVEPQNIKQAAYILQAAFSWFPKNTVHLVVVDPGVGGERRPLIVKTDKYFFVAPDNGVLTSVLDSDEVQTYKLAKPEYFLDPISSTFHGRDIFAPAAAWIAKGTPLSNMGIRVYDPKTLDFPQPEFKDNVLTGEVVYIDRFGNLISNISLELLQQYFKMKYMNLQVKIGDKTAGDLVDSYSRCSKGRVGCIINSWSNLEVFCSEASAVNHFKSRIGVAITVRQDLTVK